MEAAKQPAIIVLFGITGDLAQRKLLPALYNLFVHDLLHPSTQIVGVSRRTVSVESVLSNADLPKDGDPNMLASFAQTVRMHTMTQTDPAEYVELREILDGIEEEAGACMHRLFYLSIPPQMFQTIVGHLGEQGLSQGCTHGTASSRLLVEKPFGYDTASAEDLLQQTAQYFSEQQVFRIDHYLAKDAVQNIAAFRQSAPAVEDLWNSSAVSEIRVSVTEKLDIEGRAEFYEGVGALRDFVQNHLLQVLSVTAADLPESSTAQDVHNRRLAFLQGIQPIEPDGVSDQTVRGQYQRYREEVNNPDSNTETFARVRLYSKNPRWQDTTFVLETGKALAEKSAKVHVTFKPSSGLESLTFYIQPEKGIVLSGSTTNSQPSDAVGSFNQSHGVLETNKLGYERVFADAINGDHTIFTTSEEVITAWRIVETVVQAWQQNGDSLVFYEKGSVTV